MSDDGFGLQLDTLRAVVESRLQALVPDAEDTPALLGQAARYALLAPAKRLRPTLALLAAAHFGGEGAQAAALDPACAIEMVHTASLVLDDLPSMDDAALRRGRPAAHRRFGEDIAILSAVGLLNQAFAVIAAAQGVPPVTRLKLVAGLSGAVGFEGLVAGQARDLRERGQTRDAARLHRLNHQKTGVLFVAAVETGALVAGARGQRLKAAGGFALHLGSAFQLMDDLIDATGNSEDAGKDVGQDAGKPTVLSVIGPDEARREMRLRLERALDCLQPAEPAGPLSRFAEALFEPASMAA